MQSSSRRQFLLGSSATIGSLSLSGCATLNTAASNLLGVDATADDYGGTARAREIFSYYEQGLPIPIALNGNTDATRKTRLIKNYEAGKRSLEKRLAKGAPVYFDDVINDLGEPVAQIMRYCTEKAAEQDKDAYEKSKKSKRRRSSKVTRKGARFTIPPGRVLSYEQKGYCMDPSLPAPGAGDAITLKPIANRVPGELMPLYEAMNEAGVAGSGLNMQGMTWTLMGADTGSRYARNVDQQTLRSFDRVMPGGAQLFQDYASKQALKQRALNFLLETTNLDRYVKAADLLNPHEREAAISDHLTSLISQGERMTGGKGVGYTMLADGVAAAATGSATLTMRVKIINASEDDHEHNIVKFFGQPAAKKQSISGVPIIKGESEGKVDTEKENEPRQPIDGDLVSLARLPPNEFIRALFKDLTKFSIEKSLGKLHLLTPGAAQAAKRVVVEGSDYFRVPSMASKKALQALGAVISAVPVAGNILSGYELISGKNWLTGEDLTVTERVLAGLGTIPGANFLNTMAKVAKISGGASKLFDAGKKMALPIGIDQTERIRDTIGWLDSSSATEATGLFGDNSTHSSLNRFSEKSKEISRASHASIGTLPWTSEAKKALEKQADSTSDFLRGLFK